MILKSRGVEVYWERDWACIRLWKILKKDCDWLSLDHMPWSMQIQINFDQKVRVPWLATFGQVHTPSLWLGGMRKQQHIFESHFSCGLSRWGSGDTSQKRRCYFWNKRVKDILGRKEKIMYVYYGFVYKNFRLLLKIIDNLFTLSLDFTESY